MRARYEHRGMRRGLRRCALFAALLLSAAGMTACTPPGLPAPITPSGPTSSPSSPPPAGTVVIGLDGLAGRITGFNPYSIADFSLASQAATSLVLPSAFVVGADGRPAADPDVVDAAVVTSQLPFTVTYTVDRKASWSDGT
ncbi:MAG: ABC transporter family substrate-binding protein, partial [Nakamurella sp.]